MSSPAARKAVKEWSMRNADKILEVFNCQAQPNLYRAFEKLNYCPDLDRFS